MARLPSTSVPVDDQQPMTTRGYNHDWPPPPPPAPHGTTHGKPPAHWEIVGQAHLRPRKPDRAAAMSNSDGSPPRDNRHHPRSRSRPPIFPECMGETPAERKERRLAEAAVPVGLPTGPL